MELKELLEIKKTTYNFLSKCYLEEPTEEFIKYLLDEKILEDFPVWIETERVVAACKELKEYSERCRAMDLTEVLNDVKEDYTALFIGPGHLLAPPWESVYRSKERLVFGNETLAVREFYARHDLQIPRLYKEPDDHIGYELGLLSNLCNQSIQCIQENNEDKLLYYLNEQKVFIQTHLLKWVPEFCEDIIKNCKTGFFSGIAGLTWFLLEGSD